MIKIRLSRGGKKNSPFYRIVAIEKSRKRDGKYLEIIGTWNPTKDEKKIKVDRLEHWIGNGAVVSDSVKKLLEK